MRYTVFDATGAAVLGPSGAGVTESPSQPGLYLAALTFDSRWCGRIEWIISGLAGVGAVDDFGRALGGYSVAVASFGAANTGLAGAVGLTVLDTAGNVLAARTAAGIVESAQLAGTYWTPVFLAAGWCGYLQWDVAGRAGLLAVEEFGPGTSPVTFAPVTVPERPDAPR